MGENSNISWTDHTFNPWIGCEKVSPGCKNCYAAEQDNFRKWTPEGWGGPRKRTSVSNWKQPLRWNNAPCQQHHIIACEECPRPRVFCASLADWLDKDVPITWLAALLDLIHDTPNLDWLLLTKRPENREKRLNSIVNSEIDAKSSGVELAFSWLHGLEPHNVWIGTTVENQEYADRRIPELLKIPARVRFLSCEPLLSEVKLGLTRKIDWAYAGGPDECPHGYAAGIPCQKCKPNGIHWVIAGGESGPNRREMNIEWAQSLHDQCKAAGVPFFMKQDSGPKSGMKGRIPDELWIKEFPSN